MWVCVYVALLYFSHLMSLFAYAILENKPLETVTACVDIKTNLCVCFHKDRHLYHCTSAVSVAAQTIVQTGFEYLSSDLWNFAIMYG